CHIDNTAVPARAGTHAATVSGADRWVPAFAGTMHLAISGGAANGSQHLAAIDRDGLAGDPGGERRGEERHHLSHLLRPAEPTERDAAQDGAVKRGLAVLLRSQVPPGNSIDPGATQLTRIPFLAKR